MVSQRCLFVCLQTFVAAVICQPGPTTATDDPLASVSNSAGTSIVGRSAKHTFPGAVLPIPEGYPDIGPEQFNQVIQDIDKYHDQEHRQGSNLGQNGDQPEQTRQEKHDDISKAINEVFNSKDTAVNKVERRGDKFDPQSTHSSKPFNKNYESRRPIRDFKMETPMKPRPMLYNLKPRQTKSFIIDSSQMHPNQNHLESSDKVLQQILGYGGIDSSDIPVEGAYVTKITTYNITKLSGKEKGFLLEKKENFSTNLNYFDSNEVLTNYSNAHSSNLQTIIGHQPDQNQSQGYIPDKLYFRNGTLNKIDIKYPENLDETEESKREKENNIDVISLWDSVGSNRNNPNKHNEFVGGQYIGNNHEDEAHSKLYTTQRNRSLNVLQHDKEIKLPSATDFVGGQFVVKTTGSESNSGEKTEKNHDELLGVTGSDISNHEEETLTSTYSAPYNPVTTAPEQQNHQNSHRHDFVGGQFVDGPGIKPSERLGQSKPAYKWRTPFEFIGGQLIEMPHTTNNPTIGSSNSHNASKDLSDFVGGQFVARLHKEDNNLHDQFNEGEEQTESTALTVGQVLDDRMVNDETETMSSIDVTSYERETEIPSLASRNDLFFSDKKLKGRNQPKNEGIEKRPMEETMEDVSNEDVPNSVTNYYDETTEKTRRSILKSSVTAYVQYDSSEEERSTESIVKPSNKTVSSKFRKQSVQRENNHNNSMFRKNKTQNHNEVLFYEVPVVSRSPSESPVEASFGTEKSVVNATKSEFPFKKKTEKAPDRKIQKSFDKNSPPMLKVENKLKKGTAAKQKLQTLLIETLVPDSSSSFLDNNTNGSDYTTTGLYGQNRLAGNIDKQALYTITPSSKGSVVLNTTEDDVSVVVTVFESPDETTTKGTNYESAVNDENSSPGNATESESEETEYSTPREGRYNHSDSSEFEEYETDDTDFIGVSNPNKHNTIFKNDPETDQYVTEIVENSLKNHVTKSAITQGTLNVTNHGNGNSSEVSSATLGPVDDNIVGDFSHVHFNRVDGSDTFPLMPAVENMKRAKEYNMPQTYNEDENITNIEEDVELFAGRGSTIDSSNIEVDEFGNSITTPYPDTITFPAETTTIITEESSEEQLADLCISLKNEKNVSLYDLVSGQLYLENNDKRVPLALKGNPFKNCHSGTKRCKLSLDLQNTVKARKPTSGNKGKVIKNELFPKSRNEKRHIPEGDLKVMKVENRFERSTEVTGRRPIRKQLPSDEVLPLEERFTEDLIKEIPYHHSFNIKQSHDSAAYHPVNTKYSSDPEAYQSGNIKQSPDSAAYHPVNTKYSSDPEAYQSGNIKQSPDSAAYHPVNTKYSSDPEAYQSGNIKQSPDSAAYHPVNTKYSSDPEAYQSGNIKQSHDSADYHPVNTKYSSDPEAYQSGNIKQSPDSAAYHPVNTKYSSDPEAYQSENIKQSSNSPDHPVHPKYGSESENYQYVNINQRPESPDNHPISTKYGYDPADAMKEQQTFDKYNPQRLPNRYRLQPEEPRVSHAPSQGGGDGSDISDSSNYGRGFFQDKLNREIATLHNLDANEKPDEESLKNQPVSRLEVVNKKRPARTATQNRNTVDTDGESKKEGSCGCSTNSLLQAASDPINYKHFVGKRNDILTNIVFAVKDWVVDTQL